MSGASFAECWLELEDHVLGNGLLDAGKREGCPRCSLAALLSRSLSPDPHTGRIACLDGFRLLETLHGRPM